MSAKRLIIDRKCQQKLDPKYIAVMAATFVVLLFVAIPATDRELDEREHIF